MLPQKNLHYANLKPSRCPKEVFLDEPITRAIMFSGQIVICKNCGSFVCRRFALTPRFFQSIPTLGFAEGTGNGYAQQ